MGSRLIHPFDVAINLMLSHAAFTPILYCLCQSIQDKHNMPVFFSSGLFKLMAKSLQEHLVSADGVAQLAAHAQRLLAFQRTLETVLPEALRPHARVANFRLGKIFIHTSNSAVAAKVRQLGPRIASALSSSASKVTEIGVSVQACRSTRPQEPRERPVLPSNQQKQRLALLAQNLPPDSALKRAIDHLLKAVTE
jgi:hypothetical protein